MDYNRFTLPANDEELQEIILYIQNLRNLDKREEVDTFSFSLSTSSARRDKHTPTWHLCYGTQWELSLFSCSRLFKYTQSLPLQGSASTAQTEYA